MAAFVRTSLVGVLLASAALFIYWRVSSESYRRTIAEMSAIQEEMEQRLEAKEAMVQRLNRTRRVAHIRVLDQQAAPDGAILETTVLFIELDDDGAALGRQQFTLPGDVLFVDAWTVKFSHEDVAEGHPLRGHTLMLLRRIYSDRMAPIDGYPIDVPGAVPPFYASGEVGEFEKRVWEHFWQLADDPKAARALGIRVAQGEAVYKPVRAGRVYELTLDAAGGMSLRPLEETGPEA